MTRIYAVRVLKFVFAASTACFLFIQLEMLRESKWGGSSAASSGEPVTAEDLLVPPHVPKSAVVVERGVPPPPAGGNQSEVKENLSKLPASDDIRKLIEENNAHAEIIGEREFGTILERPPTVIVVVQVHNRPRYLAKLVESLGKARGVDKTLLVVSHDFYSPELNELVHAIRFCRVLQVFYPYPIQIFPDTFPGQDPRDCPANLGREKARELRCQNWAHPDKYGHYRVASYTQIKHHWWWKINYVFDGIAALRLSPAPVLLLEEDHFVAPDVFHVLDTMVRNRATLCPECAIMALGFYLKSYGNYANTIAHFAIYPWFSSRHNMGMVITRELWNRFRDCSKNFCTYDDYNWDWSLMHVNLKCLKAPMSVLFAKSPRVFHIGDCGIHHKGKQCTADTSATKVLEILSGVESKLFPEKMEVSERSRRTLKPPKENGGWGDLRDHELCLNHTKLEQDQRQANATQSATR